MFLTEAPERQQTALWVGTCQHIEPSVSLRRTQL